MSSDKNKTRARILKATCQLMEQNRGIGVSMADIAKAAGISRQAVYLHFPSRTELMIATTHYVDDVKGFPKKLERLYAATNGEEMLEICIEIWGNYIPEIFGLAKAFMKSRETDEATAAAWNGCMGCFRDDCRKIITTLYNEGILASAWTPEKAAEVLWTMLSIHNWEQLTMECCWSNKEYIDHMKTLAQRTFIDSEAVQK